MFLLVGLGNPGKDYENTRHNVGFKAVDAIAHRFSFSSYSTKFQSLVAAGSIDGQRVIAIKPQTFMNRSGVAVQSACQFYKIPPEDVVVIQDDLDIDVGKVKAKIGGGAAGQNGIKDIDNHIGKDYRRVRIGIGHPGDRDQVSHYVLQAISKADAPKIDACIDAIVEAMPAAYDKTFPSVFMNKVATQLNPPLPKDKKENKV